MGCASAPFGDLLLRTRQLYDNAILCEEFSPTTPNEYSIWIPKLRVPPNILECFSTDRASSHTVSVDSAATGIENPAVSAYWKDTLRSFHASPMHHVSIFGSIKRISTLLVDLQCTGSITSDRFVLLNALDVIVDHLDWLVEQSASPNVAFYIVLKSLIEIICDLFILLISTVTATSSNPSQKDAKSRHSIIRSTHRFSCLLSSLLRSHPSKPVWTLALASLLHRGLVRLSSLAQMPTSSYQIDCTELQTLYSSELTNRSVLLTPKRRKNSTYSSLCFPINDDSDENSLSPNTKINTLSNLLDFLFIFFFHRSSRTNSSSSIVVIMELLLDRLWSSILPNQSPPEPRHLTLCSILLNELPSDESQRYVSSMGSFCSSCCCCYSTVSASHVFTSVTAFIRVCGKSSSGGKSKLIANTLFRRVVIPLCLFELTCHTQSQMKAIVNNWFNWLNLCDPSTHPVGTICEKINAAMVELMPVEKFPLVALMSRSMELMAECSEYIFQSLLREMEENKRIVIRVCYRKQLILCLLRLWSCQLSDVGGDLPLRDYENRCILVWQQIGDLVEASRRRDQSSLIGYLHSHLLSLLQSTLGFWPHAKTTWHCAAFARIQNLLHPRVNESPLDPLSVCAHLIHPLHVLLEGCEMDSAVDERYVTIVLDWLVDFIAPYASDTDAMQMVHLLRAHWPATIIVPETDTKNNPTSCPSSRASVFLLRLTFRLLNRLLFTATATSLHPGFVNSWKRFVAHDSDLVSALTKSSTKIDLRLLLDELLSTMNDSVADSHIQLVIAQLLHAIVTGAQRGVQLSSENLKQIIHSVERVLKNPSDFQSIADESGVAVRKSSANVFILSLIYSLTGWVEQFNPLTPSQSITWPMFDRIKTCAQRHRCRSSTEQLPITPVRHSCFTLAYLSVIGKQADKCQLMWSPLSRHTPSQSCTLQTNCRSGVPASLRAGFFISMWLQYSLARLQKSTTRPTHRNDNLHGDEFSTAAREMIHLISLEGVTEMCGMKEAFVHTYENLHSDWSIQIWIRLDDPQALYVRAHRTLPYMTSHVRKPTRLTFDGLPEPSNCFAVGGLWLHLPRQPFNEGAGDLSSVDWHNILLAFRATDEYVVRVNLFMHGRCVATGHLAMNSAVTIPMPNISALQPHNLSDTDQRANGVLLYMGQESSFPLLDANVNISMGNILLFTAIDNDDEHVTPDQFSLYLNFLGSNWTGWFDSIDCGAGYGGRAWCLLPYLIQSAHNAREMDDMGDTAGAACDVLLQTATRELASCKWLNWMRQSVVKKYLFAVFCTHCPDRVFYRHTSTSLSSSDGQNEHGTVGSEGSCENGYPNWLVNPSHVAHLHSALFNPTGTVGVESEHTKIQLPTECHPSINEAFEPHGGITVAFYLLGQIVCNERKVLSNTGDLQAASLDLLLALIQRCTTMASTYLAPALPDSGLELPVSRSRKATRIAHPTVALSVGDCLLARLLKHPNFDSTNPKVTEVLLKRIFLQLDEPLSQTQSENSSNSCRRSSYLLVNPSLVRCLLTFGPIGLWSLSHHESQSRLFRGTSLLHQVMHSIADLLTMPTSVSTIASVTATILDRWQIIPIALTAYYDTFVKKESSGDYLHDVIDPTALDALMRLTQLRLLCPLTTSNRLGGHDEKAARDLFLRLCRMLVRCDADLYFRAKIRESNSNPSAMGLVADSIDEVTNPIDLWTIWNRLGRECMIPERRVSNGSPPRYPSGGKVSITVSNADRSVCETQTRTPCTLSANSPLVTCTTERTKFDLDKSQLVDWTALPYNEATAPTELAALTRYLANLTGAGVGGSALNYAVSSPHFCRAQSGDDEEIEDEAVFWSDPQMEIGLEAKETMLCEGSDGSLDHGMTHLVVPHVALTRQSKIDCYPMLRRSNRQRSAPPDGIHRSDAFLDVPRVVAPNSGDYSTSPSTTNERDGILAAAILHLLDSVWSMALEYWGDQSSEQTDSHKRHILTRLRPPVWLVDCLLNHSSLRARETGIQGYRVWLMHTIRVKKIMNKRSSMTLGQSSQGKLLPLTFASKLLRLSTQTVWLNGVKEGHKPPPVYTHRHYCSTALMDRAFAFVIFDSVISRSSNASLNRFIKINVSNPNSTNFSSTTSQGDQQCQRTSERFQSPYSNANDTRNARESTGVELYKSVEHSVPILLAVLFCSGVDAIGSLSSSNSTLTETTDEMQLCVTGITALINLFQMPRNHHLFRAALKAGLLPMLYQLAHLLESRATSAKAGSTLLITLNRLLGRVTEWLLDDNRDWDTDPFFTMQSRFEQITNLIRCLAAMRCSTMEDVSVDIQATFDPGPISRCLVRRMLYSLLNTSVRQLHDASSRVVHPRERNGPDQIARPNVASTESLLARVSWTVNFTVDLLTYSVPLENRLTRFLQSYVGFCQRESDNRVNITLGPQPFRGVRSRTIHNGHQYLQENTQQRPPIFDNPWQSFQQSLDQSLVTSLFSIASSIQNGLLCFFPDDSAVSASQCLTLFAKAIGRLLVSKLLEPTDPRTALDPMLTYLLKLSHEESELHEACLSSLPRLFAHVYWSSLTEFENWLVRLVPLEFHHATAPHTMQQADNLLHASHADELLDELPNRQLEERDSPAELMWRQLGQLIQLSRRLPLAMQSARNGQNDLKTRSLPSRERELLRNAQVEAKRIWCLRLAECGEYPTKVMNRYKPQLPSAIRLLLPSFGIETSSDSSYILQVTPLSSSSSRRGSHRSQQSSQHSAKKANRLCLEAHRAWKEAHDERIRVAGPLSTVLWHRIAECINHHGALFFDADSAPSVRCVDPVEGPMRQRRRTFLIHLPLADRLVYPDRQHVLAHNRAPHPLATLIGLPSRWSPPPGRSACVWADLPLYLPPLPATPLIQLAMVSSHPVLGVWSCRLVGLPHLRPVEGDLILGASWLRFQPIADTTSGTAEALFHVSPIERLWLAWPLCTIDHVEERRFGLRNLAVEIFPDGTGVTAPILFAMRSTQDRDRFIQTLLEKLDRTNDSFSSSITSSDLRQHDETPRHRSRRLSSRRTHRRVARRRQHVRRLQQTQRSWLDGHLSNFAYLMQLNSLAGRTYNDLMQYPVFPWVIADYTSNVLDLGHPNTYRRLDRPIAVQLDDRANKVAQHYTVAEQLAEMAFQELCIESPGLGASRTPSMRRFTSELAGLVCPPYHYPSHCSNEAIVLNFLIRLPPYTFRHLRFQDNNYDVPDRMFHSVETTWNLATTTVTCVKELVPEWYFMPELFVNNAGLALGTRQPGQAVDLVQLPPWSKNNPRLFTLVCRAALERDHATNTLSDWVDLMFGYKQVGPAAKTALNLYHPYTYFGAVDVDQIADRIRALAVEAMISNYGQTPRQLFKNRPHPSRFDVVAAAQANNLLAQQQQRNAEDDDSIGSTMEVLQGASHTLSTNALQDDDETPSSSHEPDERELDNPHRITSTHCDITPLETVIGLRWGTWAGSPHAAPLRLVYKVATCRPSSLPSDGTTLTASPTVPIGHLSGLVWYAEDKLTCTNSPSSFSQSCNLEEHGMTYTMLRDAWDGWTLRPPLPISAFTLSSGQWKWTVAGCESLARLCLIPSYTSQTASPEMVKISVCSMHRSTLHIRTKHLETTSGVVSAVNLTLNLPCDAKPRRGSEITALEVTKFATANRMQLFVGTSNGIVYCRALPLDLRKVNSSGWLPEDHCIRSDQQPPHTQTSSRSSGSTHSPMSPKGAAVGLWEVTGWRPIYGHAGCTVTGLAVSDHYGLVASGDASGHVYLWDLHRLTFVCHINTNCLHQVPIGCHHQHHPSPNEADDSQSPGSMQESSPDIDSKIADMFEQLMDANPEMYGAVDGLCFSPTSGELAVARRGIAAGCQACWLGVFSTSGTPVATRIVDFSAEISDCSLASHPTARSSPSGDDEVGDPLDCPVPMAYSTVDEGHGVNCLLIGGPGGRLVWLNSWTLDTVHTMLLPQSGASPSSVTSVCFLPSANQIYQTVSHKLGEMLCQAVCVTDQAGWLYYLAPGTKQALEISGQLIPRSTSHRNSGVNRVQESVTIPVKDEEQKQQFKRHETHAKLPRGIWLD